MKSIKELELEVELARKEYEQTANAYLEANRVLGAANAALAWAKAEIVPGDVVFSNRHKLELKATRMDENGWLYGRLRSKGDWQKREVCAYKSWVKVAA